MQKIKVDIVVPVCNEERILEKNINSLREFLLKNPLYEWKIIIAENASTDKTPCISKRISSKFKNVFYLHINKKGRGYALKKAWLESKSDIVSYMDADLSTRLKNFLTMISAINNGFDVALGSRLLHSSTVKRSLKRKILSRGYNFLVRLFLNTKFSDAQCGFKALRKDVANKLIPLVKDNEWFFDTELLVLAEKEGYRLFEVPVHWVEHDRSSVNIPKTILAMSKNLLRLYCRMKKRRRSYGTGLRAEIPSTRKK
jgi:glycosyltransferase involved in cell wall biosynthesis